MHDVEFHNAQSPLKMIRVINEEDVVGGTCGMRGEKGKICRVCFKNLKKKKSLRDLGIDGKYILKLVFN